MFVLINIPSNYLHFFLENGHFNRVKSNLKKVFCHPAIARERIACQNYQMYEGMGNKLQILRTTNGLIPNAQNSSMRKYLTCN